MSIRTRLAAAVALVLLVTVAALELVVVRATRATLVDQLDDELREQAGRTVSGAGGYGGSRGPGGPRPGGDYWVGRDGSAGDPPGSQVDPTGTDQDLATPSLATTEDETLERAVAVFVYGPDGSLRRADPSGYPDDPDPPPSLPGVAEAGTRGGTGGGTRGGTGGALDGLVGRIVTRRAVDGSRAYRVLARRGPGGVVVVVAAPLAPVDAVVRRLARSVLAVGAVALLVATLASSWLIRRGLRPVDKMVETAAAIAAGDLGRRVPDADPRTELGRLGGALNEMLGRIEAAVRARAAGEERLRRFVADAAHELRTPLTSLRGYAELYRQGALPTPDAVANAMGRIEAEGARMARLVDDLLLLARLDQQRGLERRPVDLAAVVREAIADFGAVAPDRPVTEDLAAGATVAGDRARLRQVVDNLLANARVHTPPGTPVHVTVAAEGDHVAVTVADEGPGLAEADRARVFERFWRVDPGRARSRGGSGLGLAIVASLVVAHGGTVEVHSEPGRGAAFTVRLPRSAEVPLPARGAPVAQRGVVPADRNGRAAARDGV